MGILDKFKRTKSEGKKELKKMADRVEKSSVKELVKTEDKVVAEKKSTKKSVGLHVRAHRILLHPLISEKAAIAESHGAYTFIVANRANKEDVKKAVKEIYGAKAEKVRILNVNGQVRRFGRATGRTADFKKAIVYLKKGETIGVHEGV
ncbi:MAG TPA: 50S ribosomal protein L23 [Candidatus Magasanikbacteria bacterium]|mgnify:CR=1 FL=1|nr:50S ribosomal protein L23 [Candidatus Magasanikbacteria bacterium]